MAFQVKTILGVGWRGFSAWGAAGEVSASTGARDVCCQEYSGRSGDMAGESVVSQKEKSVLPDEV